jgi:glycosyltransferase 2 family protein
MVISVVALALALSRVEGDEVRVAFGDASYIWLVPATGFALSALAFRSVRWRALLHPLELRIRQLFGFMLVGYTVNTVFPLRAGDLARAHLIGQVHGESRLRTFATIVVEHLLDAVAVVVIILVLAPFLAFPEWAAAATWVAISVAIFSSAGIGWLWWRRERSLSAVEHLAARVPLLNPEAVRERFGSVIDGFSALQSRRASGVVVLCSALTWLSGGLMMWMVLVAFGMPHSFQAAMFLVAMSAIALAIPSSPGFVGVYHVLLIEAAVLVLGVSSGAAASFAVVSHLLLFVPPVVLGIAYMIARPHVWNELLRWRTQRT